MGKSCESRYSASAVRRLTGPSKPPGCRSRRCRRRTSSLFGAQTMVFRPGHRDVLPGGSQLGPWSSRLWVGRCCGVPGRRSPRTRGRREFAQRWMEASSGSRCGDLGDRVVALAALQHPRQGKRGADRAGVLRRLRGGEREGRSNTGTISTATRPSKPPGCRSRRCRRRTWRSFERPTALARGDFSWIEAADDFELVTSRENPEAGTYPERLRVDG